MAQYGLLDQFVDVNTLECLNQKEANPVKNAFTDDDSELLSDVDAQMIVKLEFRQPVKLNSIRITSGAEEGTAPKLVKIYQGKPDISFNDVEDLPSIQDLDMGEEEAKGKDMPLRFVKFQSVKSLQLFFAENANPDEKEHTSIKRIQLLGEPAQAMDMKDWKPIKG
mmetsp:Transcript_5444/g.15445  ORF Transcript_5444/g.15445 Transcript_5444/m.15445 type:complete len:166 (-) Transcript_5444:7-504(-)